MSPGVSWSVVGSIVSHFAHGALQCLRDLRELHFVRTDVQGGVGKPFLRSPLSQRPTPRSENDLAVVATAGPCFRSANRTG